MRQSVTVLLLFVIFVSALTLVTGCTSQSATPPTISPPPPTMPTASQVTLVSPTLTAAPGPVQTVPDFESINVGVSRNSISENPTIITTFNGGLGLGMVEHMDVTVIRSDGVEETGSVANPTTGAQITLLGTTTTDHVIVYVTMTSGQQYTIIDNYYPFPGGVGNNGA